MPKRKVTFQGVGNEDNEDETSVPKKKVRRPDSYFWGRVRGRKKDLVPFFSSSQKREKALRMKQRVERASFPCSLRNGFGGFSV